MRAREIQEAASKPASIVQVDAGTWYETSAAQVTKWYRNWFLVEPDLDSDPSIRYFVFVPQAQKLWSLDNKVVWLKDSHLSSLASAGKFYTKQEGAALQALADVTQAKQGERVWGDFVLYDGKVYDKHELPQSLPVVAQLSTGEVHEVPASARWTLGRIYLKYKVSADRVVMFRNTLQDVSAPWSTASIKAGKIMEIQSQRKLDPVTQVKLHKELTQALALQQKVSVKTHIVPESKLHDVLRAVMDNPEVDRPKLYWRVLQLVKMPAYRSADDPLLELVKMGLVKETHKDPSTYYMSGAERTYSITPVGKLVLARLKSGKPVDKSSLIKP